MLEEYSGAAREPVAPLHVLSQAFLERSSEVNFNSATGHSEPKSLVPLRPC